MPISSYPSLFITESFLFYNDRQDRPSNRVLATLCAASIERLIAAFRKRSHHNVQQQSAAVAEDNNMRSAPCVLLFVVSADVEELAAKMLQTLVNAHTKEDPKEVSVLVYLEGQEAKLRSIKSGPLNNEFAMFMA